MLRREQTDFLNKILSDKEKEMIQSIVENRPLIEAIRKVLLSGVYTNGTMKPDQPADPLQNFVLGAMSQPLWANAPMAEKGQKITAIIDAVGMVESGFEGLDYFRKVEAETEPQVNKAR